MKKMVFLILFVLFAAGCAVAQSPGSPTQTNSTTYYLYKRFLGADSAFLVPQRDTAWLPSRPALVYQPSDSALYYWNWSSWIKLGQADTSNDLGLYLLKSSFIDSLNANRQQLTRVGDSAYLTFGGAININPDSTRYATRYWVSTQGYITEEVDPVFTSSPAYNITQTNINDWQTAYNSASYSNDTLYLVAVNGAQTKLHIAGGGGGGTDTLLLDQDSLRIKGGPAVSLDTLLNAKQDTGYSYSKSKTDQNIHDSIAAHPNTNLATDNLTQPASTSRSYTVNGGSLSFSNTGSNGDQTQVIQTPQSFTATADGVTDPSTNYTQLSVDSSRIAAVGHNPDGSVQNIAEFHGDGSISFPPYKANSGDTLAVGVNSTGGLVTFDRSSGGTGENLANTDLTQTDATRVYEFNSGSLSFLDNATSPTMGISLNGTNGSIGALTGDNNLSLTPSEFSIYTSAAGSNSFFHIRTSDGLISLYPIEYSAPSGDTLALGVDEGGNVVKFDRSSGGGGTDSTYNAVYPLTKSISGKTATFGADTTTGVLTHRQYTDSTQANALSVLSPLTIDVNAKTLGADTTRSGPHFATQFYADSVAAHGGTDTITQVAYPLTKTITDNIQLLGLCDGCMVSDTTDLDSIGIVNSANGFQGTVLDSLGGTDSTVVLYTNGDSISAHTLRFSGGGGGTGTVSSVGLLLPTSLYTISGSPVTTTGTLTGTLKSQTANTVFRVGTSSAVPSFSALAATDIPSLAASKITSGTMATARLGSGTASSSTYLRGDGTWSTIPDGDNLGNANLTQSDAIRSFNTDGNVLYFKDGTSNLLQLSGTGNYLSSFGTSTSASVASLLSGTLPVATMYYQDATWSNTVSVERSGISLYTNTVNAFTMDSTGAIHMIAPITIDGTVRINPRSGSSVQYNFGSDAFSMLQYGGTGAFKADSAGNIYFPDIPNGDDDGTVLTTGANGIVKLVSPGGTFGGSNIITSDVDSAWTLTSSDHIVIVHTSSPVYHEAFTLPTSPAPNQEIKIYWLSTVAAPSTTIILGSGQTGIDTNGGGMVNPPGTNTYTGDSFKYIFLKYDTASSVWYFLFNGANDSN